MLIAYWAVVFYFEHRLPEIFSVSDYMDNAKEMNRVLGRNGEVLAEEGEEKRTIAMPEEIPQRVKDAVLAAEDADFYSHGGLDYLGMARAMYRNLKRQSIREGASTITQQVAKTFFLSSERTVSRKLKEVVLARELEEKLSKDEILFLYLNQIYWGHGRYGIKEAANYYFAKTFKELTLAEAALLAGLIAAPERFSPFKNPKKALERRAFVLDQLARHGVLDIATTEAAKLERVSLAERRTDSSNIGKYATAMVNRFVLDKLGEERVKRGGLRVFTTIDVETQAAAERAVQTSLVELDQQYGLARPLEQLPASRIADRVEQLARQRAKGIRSGEIVTGVVTGFDAGRKAFLVHVGLGECLLPETALSRYSRGSPSESLFAVGDVVRVSPRLPLTGAWQGRDKLPLLNLDQGPQAALVAMDPRSREVLAIVGGYDYATHPFNRASMAKRQAGSTIKPFVYAAALEAGVIDAGSRFDNVPETYRFGNESWTPRNYTGDYDGKSYSARMALAKSVNVIAVKVLERTGVKKFSDFVKRVGINSPVAPDLSVALGSTAVSPLELVNAYATLASGGLVDTPLFVSRIEDARGNVLWKHAPQRRRGTTAAVAFRITEMMQAVVTHGTAKALSSLGRPIAGKTGTTDKGIDTWFAGFTPELATVVWVGFDDMRAVDKATGGTIAAPLWSRFVASVLDRTPPSTFKRPSGLDPLGPVEAIGAGTRPPATDEPAGGPLPIADEPAGGGPTVLPDGAAPSDQPGPDEVEPLPGEGRPGAAEEPTLDPDALYE